MTRVGHLTCTGCGANPNYALIDGEGHLVCHCTHDDGPLDPWPVHGFEGHPPEWEYVATGEAQCAECGREVGETIEWGDRGEMPGVCPKCYLNPGWHRDTGEE